MVSSCFAGASEDSSSKTMQAAAVPAAQQQAQQQQPFPQAYGAAVTTKLSGPAAMCPPIPTVRSRPVMPALPGPDDAPLTRDERVAR